MGKIEQVDTKHFKEKLAATTNPLIIDVRTPAEYQMGHIEGAINVNYFSWRFRRKVSALGPKATVFVYCASAKRSSLAAKIMTKLGFEHIIDLAGGYQQWRP